MVDYRAIIRRKREKKGLSQSALARCVGISQTSMWEIEKGRKSPSVEVLFKICDALDIRLFPDEEDTP